MTEPRGQAGRVDLVGPSLVESKEQRSRSREARKHFPGQTGAWKGSRAGMQWWKVRDEKWL